MAKALKPIPEGYNSITAFIVVKDAEQAIDFYKRAFGAKEIFRMNCPDGTGIAHSELKIGDSRLMLSDEMEGQGTKAVQTLGGSPIAFYLYVDNVDQAFKRAIDAGAHQDKPLMDMFWGDRCGSLVDPFGVQWTIATQVEEFSPSEIEERGKQFFEKMKAA